MTTFKISDADTQEIFTTIKNSRILIDKVHSTETVDFYMIYAKTGSEGRGVYSLCGMITIKNSELYAEYNSDEKLISHALMLRCKVSNENIDGAFYKALENIVTVFKLEFHLK